MEVGLWMTTDLVTIAPDAPLSAAARLMDTRHIRRLLVTEPRADGLALVGLVSMYDVARACPADRNPLAAGAWPPGADVPVGTIMARHVRTTTPDAPIESAARTLRAHKVGALPVLRAGRLVGIITESDLLDALPETVGTADHDVRVTIEAADGDGTLAEVVALAERHGARVASVLTLRHADRATGDVRPMVVVHLRDHSPALVEALWRSGHRVRSVHHAADVPASVAAGRS